MKTRKLILFIVLLAAAACIICACDKQKSNETEEESAVIGFEPKTDIRDGNKNIYAVLKVMTSQYWQDIANGIADSGSESGCNVYIGGPEAENDWEGQKMLIDEAVAKGADAIILAPASSSALKDTLDGVRGKGIPVILVDTIVNSDSFDICYMTDNLQAGELAGKEMLRQLKDAGISESENATIAIQITTTSSQTVIDRLAGFNQYWASNAPKNWTVLDEVKLNNGDKDRAKQNCIDIISDHPDLKGLFGCNNSSTVGFVNGLTESGRNDIVLVGFDYADETAAAISDGKHHVSTIVQNQYDMGYLGVKAAINMLSGKKTDIKFKDTGTVVINNDNYLKYEAGDKK